MEKVDEEISELHEAINSKESSAIYHELGDVCLALSSLARHLNISLEDVFMAAIQRFDLRWETMMRVAENSQINVRDLSPTEWEKLWQQAKIQVDKH